MPGVESLLINEICFSKEIKLILILLHSVIILICEKCLLASEESIRKGERTRASA